MGLTCRSLSVAPLVSELKYGFFLTGAKIQQQLAKIQNNVKKLQQQLRDVKPTPDCKQSSAEYSFLQMLFLLAHWTNVCLSSRCLLLSVG